MVSYINPDRNLMSDNNVWYEYENTCCRMCYSIGKHLQESVIHIDLMINHLSSTESCSNSSTGNDVARNWRDTHLWHTSKHANSLLCWNSTRKCYYISRWSPLDSIVSIRLSWSAIVLYTRTICDETLL